MILGVGCAAIAAGIILLMRRAYRDPDNWRIDVERGGIRFNHWKEIWLGGVVISLVLIAFITIVI